MKNNAIVLGANGFIGLNLCYWLLQHDYEVHAISREETFAGEGIYNVDNLSYSQVDIAQLEELKRVDFKSASLIYLFAGQTGTSAGFSKYMDYVNSNEIGLLNILNTYIAQEATGRIVFPSTRLVYKGIEGEFLKEDSEKETKTVYAVNKLACENYLFAYSNAYRIPYTVFRICVPYGQLIPGDYSYGTLGFMLNQAKNQGEISLYGQGEASRTYTHMKDICEIVGTVSPMEKSSGQIINIGSKDNYSLFKLAKKIAEHFKVAVKFKDWPALDLAIESGDTMFDDATLQNIFSYQYQGDLDTFIKEL